MDQTYKILYLLSDLLDFDGTRGDFIYLESRLKAYGIAYDATYHQAGEKIDVSDFDFIYAGVCPQKYEQLYLKLLFKDVTGLQEYIESGKMMLAVEQSFLFLGKQLVDLKEEYAKPLLNIIPLNIFKQDEYVIGNILLKNMANHDFDNINGFINSRYAFELPKDANDFQPFGEILLGKDYLWKRGYEGLCYKGFIGTQLRGPILPRNYDLTDYLIKRMIDAPLPQIDSNLEKLAKDQLTKDCQRFIDTEEQKKEYVYVS